MTIIYEDESKETLKVHPDIVVRHHLFKEKTLTENTVNAMKKENASKILTEKALDILSRKDYSKEGLRKKLATHGEKEAVEDTIDYLLKVGYLNEDKALSNMVEEMWEFSLKGPKAIKHKALREHFKESSIDSRLNAYSSEAIEKRLEKFIEKTYPAYTRYPKRKIREKLLRQSITHGYDPDISRPLIESFLETVNFEKEEDDLLEKRFEAIKDKYDLEDFKSKNKLIQKLMREGFDYETIKARLK